MQSAWAVALSVSFAVLGCGDDGGGTQRDAGDIDAPERVCTAPAAIGTITFDATDEVQGSYLTYSADIGEVNGFPTTLRMRFRHTMEQLVIPGRVDIASGTANLSYERCFACFLAVSTDPSTGAEVAYYFQESGVIQFSGDPVNNRHLTMTLEDLTLQEAAFDGTTVTPNPTGGCVTLEGNVDQDNVPNAWTCAPTDYYALSNNDCQCECGVYDPDCRVATVATTGCTGPTPVCVPGTPTPTCVAAVMNDTCADAPALSAGTVSAPNPVSGTTVGAKHHYDRGLEGGTCAGKAMPGPDVVYKAILSPGVTYTVSLTGLTHDGAIAIVGPSTVDTVCTTNIAGCVAGKDSGGAGAGESLTFTPAGGQYFIIVDSPDRDGAGEFTISLTGP